MLAPHRLFNAVLDLVEHRSGEPITQHLLDTLNSTITKMVDHYVHLYGYARPEFEVQFYAEQPHSVAIVAMNQYAFQIIEDYNSMVEDSTPG